MNQRGRVCRSVTVALVTAVAITSLVASSPWPGAGQGALTLTAHAATKKCKKGFRVKRGKCVRKKPQQPAAPQAQAVPQVVSPPSGPPVYTVPASIPDDCSVPVEGEIMAWLASVPDGSTAQFGAGRCYGQDDTITLADRNGLVIDGQGSEFRALTPGGSHRASWRFVNGGNLTVRNMAVRGSNPQGLYNHAIEWQHGYSVEGVQGMILSNVKARETWGDGVYLYRGAYSPACGDDASSARNILITGALLERIGRQGVAVVDAEQVTLEDSTIGPVATQNVDIETDEACEIARHIMVARNSFGASGWTGVIANGGAGGDPQVGDVSVIDNVQTAPPQTANGCYGNPVWISSPAGVYRHDYRFSGNHFFSSNDAFSLSRLRYVEVSSNSVTFTGDPSVCGPRIGVHLSDSHSVGITSNGFIGAHELFRADALSTGITATGSTTN
jgi:hypothetical protein